MKMNEEWEVVVRKNAVVLRCMSSDILLIDMNGVTLKAIRVTVPRQEFDRAIRIAITAGMFDKF